MTHFPGAFGLISILALFQYVFRIPALLCTWFFYTIRSIDFFAGAEIFLCWVLTNGSGAVSSILFALSNFIWIHELFLGRVCFLPRRHAVDVGPSQSNLALAPSAILRVSCTFLIFFAGAEFFLRWVTTNGVSTVSSLGFTQFNFNWIHELVL